MIAVNGSYNYNMDTPQSDIDSKLLVIPSLEQLVNGKSLNYLHCMSDNGEHVEVKDIRHYFTTMLNTIKPFQKDFSALTAQVKDFLDTLTFKIVKQSTAKECNG